MSKDLDKLLDQCIDRMNTGESLEECLASYPQYAEELEPLLRPLCDARDVLSSIPSPVAKSAVRKRLDAKALDFAGSRQERGRRLVPFPGWSRAWVTVPIIILLVIIGIGIYWILMPEAAPTVAQANFKLVLSDPENCFRDFDSLKITITSVGVLHGDEWEFWEVIKLDPTKVVDLVSLSGDGAQEICSDILPQGRYSRVFIYIENAVGTVEGADVEVISPSGNLYIAKPFVVNADDSMVDFVYGITIVALGNEQTGVKYILLPEVGHVQ